MSLFSRDRARIYYEDQGNGEPIIALHGLIENTTYWKNIAEEKEMLQRNLESLNVRYIVKSENMILKNNVKTIRLQSSLNVFASRSRGIW